MQQVKMLTEWNESQFKTVKKAIAKYFFRECLYTHKGNFYKFNYAGIDEVLGLAYTSSGIDACLSVCNVELYHKPLEHLHFERFVMGEDGKVYAYLQDNEEREVLVQITNYKYGQFNMVPQ